jgi:hypothetical protein
MIFFTIVLANMKNLQKIVTVKIYGDNELQKWKCRLRFDCYRVNLSLLIICVFDVDGILHLLLTFDRKVLL